MSSFITVVAIVLFVAVLIFAISRDRDIHSSMRLPFVSFEFDAKKPLLPPDGSARDGDIKGERQPFINIPDH